MMSVSEVDVLVVGAGPAGSACAIHAASAGLKVMMVAPLLARNRPGETLHPGVEPVFDQLGVGDAIRNAGWVRHVGHRIGPEGHLIAYGSDTKETWRGFQAPTAELDRLLLDRARAVGVTVVCGLAEAPLIAGSNSVREIRGVRVGSEVIKATVTVDATGPACWARKSLRLTKSIIGPVRTVFWGHLAHVPSDLDDEPHFRELASGWLWRAPINDSCCAWVWGPDAEHSSSARAARRDLQMILGTRNIGQVRGASASSILVSQPRGCTKLLLAGDASFSLSPLSGKGVLRALLMGIAAGDVARQVVEDRSSSDRLVASYVAWITQWFQREAGNVATLHRLMRAHV